MTETIALVILGATFVVALFITRRDHERQRAEWRGERAALLDRIMARDYREYAVYAAPTPIRAAQDPHERREQEEELRLVTEAHGLA